jgi:TRAP-type C4-dicarboxylate transport system substrate-binding protein
MASEAQRQAARRNVRKAARAAKQQRTIAKLPKSTRTALGQQAAAVARRKRTGAATPKTRQELYEEAKRAGIEGRSRMGRDELERALKRRR